MTQKVEVFLTLRGSVYGKDPITLGQAKDFIDRLIDLGISLDSHFEEFTAEAHLIADSFDSISCGDCLPPNYRNDLLIDLHKH